jgi:hypothetical protein
MEEPTKYGRQSIHTVESDELDDVKFEYDEVAKRTRLESFENTISQIVELQKACIRYLDCYRGYYLAIFSSFTIYILNVSNAK